MRTVRNPAMRSMLIAVVAALATSIPACGGDGADGGSSDGVIRAVATIGMIADIVENVGGDNVMIDNPLVEYKRTAAESRTYNDDFNFAGR